MRAMILERPSKATTSPWRPLTPADLPVPTPNEDELLIRVNVCGVCRTDFDLAEGRVEASHYPVVPGHQVIGRVMTAAGDFNEGDRVGVAWINSADGTCEWCRAGTENLCPYFRATGSDADGGYAEYLTVPAAFAHAIPSEMADVAVAPLLCAGAIGWRSLRLTNLEDGLPLGLSGFGASGHLMLQLAAHRFPNSRVFVFARNPGEREFALSLGAAWAGDTSDVPPEPLGAIIDTTPAWMPIVRALGALRPGGRLVINAIRKDSRDQSALLELDYAAHLWKEREIKSVANVTRADVRECLAAASEWNVHATAREIPLEQANEALESFRTGGARGAIVLRVADG